MGAACSGIVLAGGQSRRLEQDKRRLRLWGEQGPTLLAHTLDVLAPLCDELLVVLNDQHAWPDLPARLLPDTYPDGGALGALVTGLAAARQPYSLVVAADMPLLHAGLLRAMQAHPRTYDALLPRVRPPARVRNPWQAEPLHAIYNRACLAPMQATLARGQRRITDALAGLRVVLLEPPDLARYDPHGHALRNINTPADLAAVRRLLAARGGGDAPS